MRRVFEPVNCFIRRTDTLSNQVRRTRIHRHIQSPLNDQSGLRYGVQPVHRLVL